MPGFGVAQHVPLSMQYWVVAPQIVTSEAHEPADLLPERQLSVPDVLCPAGSHMSPKSNKCEECEDGVDFTSYPNRLLSCFSCKTCDTDQNEKYPCNRTMNTVCSCKDGTFRTEGKPEACQKCQTECPAGKVMVSRCTPWSDLKCVDQESGTKATEQAPAPGRPVTSSPRTLASPCPSIDSPHSTASYICAGIFGVLAVCVILAIWKYGRQARVLCTEALVRRLKSTSTRERLSYEDPTASSSGCGQDPEQGSGGPINLSGTQRRSESQDNDHNEDLNRRALQSSLASKHETGAAGVSKQSPEETHCLLGPAEAERSPVRRKLIPASGIDPIQALRKIFDQIKDLNHNSWVPFMRELGLPDNERYLITSRNKIDPLYEMLQKWLSENGRQASINALLDALKEVGENLLREDTEKYAVDSGYFIYDECKMDSAVSSQ
ncbi:tumor necrosis factor receptor superfamily member 10A [Octodon degus]|uniref:Tumor necrosis factor receptor superfamily member 10A n=1 Tax=Octodon degus TaxID=10160 RepID=A0A6P6EEF3_OCTDE|nr:tumor necrosis factor receptor superfamily member 10A [Octodon degus]